MGYLIQLRPNGRINLRNTVTMYVTPQGRDAVEIAFPVDVNQFKPVCTGNNRWLFTDMGRHWSERVPDVLVIPSPQLFC